jgi:magnesium-transporting ATPase (P-type)
MENAYTKTPAEALRQFQVTEEKGLSEQQVRDLRQKHGRNALPEDPPTPIWELILEQFKDQLVIILLGSAAISFLLALFEDGEGWTAFVDPAVVSSICKVFTLFANIGTSRFSLSSFSMPSSESRKKLALRKPSPPSKNTRQTRPRSCVTDTLLA